MTEIPEKNAPLTRDEKRSLNRMNEHFEYVGSVSAGQGYSPFSIGLIMVIVLLALGGLSVVLLYEAFLKYPWIFAGAGLVVGAFVLLLLLHAHRTSERMEAALADDDDRRPRAR